MISVTVRYHNLLLRIAGVAGETISLHDALERLAQRHEPPLREMLFEPRVTSRPTWLSFATGGWCAPTSTTLRCPMAKN